MPEILVRNAQRKIPVAARELQDFAERALQLCLAESTRPGSVLGTLEQITVLLVSDRRIAALHREFMNIAGATDVITFHDGDIFISTETAHRQADQFGTSFDDELRLYIVHGLLHLHGFDDQSAAELRRMEAVQGRVYAAARGS